MCGERNRTWSPPEGLPVGGPRGAPSPPQAPKVQKTLKGWRGKDERLCAELLKRKQGSDLHLSQVLLSDPERKVPPLTQLLSLQAPAPGTGQPAKCTASPRAHTPQKGQGEGPSASAPGQNQVLLGFRKDRLPNSLTEITMLEGPLGPESTHCCSSTAHAHTQPEAGSKPVGSTGSHKHHLVDGHSRKAHVDLTPQLGAQDRLLTAGPPHLGHPRPASGGAEHLPRRTTRAARGGWAPRRCGSRTYRGEAEGELGCCDSIQPTSLDLDLKRNHEEQHDHVRSVRITPVGLLGRPQRARLLGSCPRAHTSVESETPG